MATDSRSRMERDSFWILHSRAWRDTSVILEVLSQRHGRIGVVVRAGRKNHQLQPFRLLSGRLSGRGELLNLTDCEAEIQPLNLTGRALFCGLYLNELLIRLLHRHDPHPEICDPYHHTLEQLAAGALPQDVLLREFELMLLDTLGYGFALEQDVAGDPIDPAGHYVLIADHGLQQQTQGFVGEHLLAMASRDWRDDVRRTARQLLRQALAAHLGDKPLVSRELFR